MLPPHSPFRIEPAGGQLHPAHFTVDGIHGCHQPGIVAYGRIKKTALPLRAAAEFSQDHPSLDIGILFLPHILKQALGETIAVQGVIERAHQTAVGGIAIKGRAARSSGTGKGTGLHKHREHARIQTFVAQAGAGQFREGADRLAHGRKRGNRAAKGTGADNLLSCRRHIFQG